MQDFPKRIILGERGIGQSLVEAGDCAEIHFLMFAVSAVDSDDGKFVTKSTGIEVRAAERLSPVCRQPFHMLRVEAMAEGVGNHFIGQYPAMPRPGKTAQADYATRGFKDRLHPFMIARLPSRCKIIGYGVVSVEVTSVPARANPKCNTHVLGTGWPPICAGRNFHSCAALRAALAK
jgi:hypothetical protein